MMNGGTTPFRTVTNARLDTKYVYIPEEDMYISLVKDEEAAAEPAPEGPPPLDMDNSRGPKDAHAIKAASLKNSLETVAGQQTFEAAHGASHKSTSDKVAGDTHDYKESHHNKVLDPKEFS